MPTAKATPSTSGIVDDLMHKHTVPDSARDALEAFVNAQINWDQKSQDPRIDGGAVMGGIQSENRDLYNKREAAETKLKTAIGASGKAGQEDWKALKSDVEIAVATGRAY